MAGDLYRALARNQNLQPSIDAVKGIVQTNKNRELMNKLVDAKLAIEGMNATPSLNYEADPLQRYKKAGNLASSSIFDAATTGGDVNTLNLYGGLLKDQVAQMKPAETKYQQFDPYKELMRVDEYGNLSFVRDAKVKPIKPTPYSQTKEAADDKFAREKELIKMRGSEDRNTAGYKESVSNKNKPISREQKITSDKEIPKLRRLIEEKSGVLANDTNNWRMTGSEENHKGLRNELNGLTNELVVRAGLEGTVNNLWQAYGKHKDLGKAIADYNEYADLVGEERVGPEQLRLIKIYFQNRTPKNNGKN